MQQLLESEGIGVKENKILHFDQCLWNPADHLPPLT